MPQTLSLSAHPIDTSNGDYKHGVVRVAWAYDNRCKGQPRRTLIFAMVELWPAEMPAPTDDGEHTKQLGNGSLQRVYIHHVATSAVRAFEWYRECMRGVVVRPEEDGTLRPSQDPTTVMIGVDQLQGEPTWPDTVLASDPSRLPFIAGWHATPRVHHLFPSTLPQFHWTEKERAIAAEWLDDHLPFRISAHKAFLGSVHLIAPNPVFRAAEVSLGQGTANTDTLNVEFQPRLGHSCEGLILVFQEDRPSGLAATEIIPVASRSLSVRLPRRCELTTETVIDRARGPLWHRGPSGFIRGISLQMGLATSKRVFTDQAEQRQEVPLIVETMRSELGDLSLPTAAISSLWDARGRQEQLRQAAAIDQRWFIGANGRRDAAATIIRLVQAAASMVLIVDPYFRKHDLGLILQIPRANVPIRILSSAAGLQGKSDDMDDPAEDLFLAVTTLARTQQMNPIQLRIMPGRRPTVHDRFLGIDGVLWLLGSSLSEFGSRGTMMLKLPDPTPVQEDLEAVWDRAKEAAQWIEKRRQRRHARSTHGTTPPREN